VEGREGVHPQRDGREVRQGAGGKIENLPVPDYIETQAKESASEYWNELDDKEKFGYASDNDLLAGSVDSGSSGHSSGDRVETSAKPPGTWSLLNLDSTGYEDTRKYIPHAPGRERPTHPEGARHRRRLRSY